MKHSGSWAPYTGSGSILLAVVLFLAACVLIYLALRVLRPVEVTRPGATIAAFIIMTWLLSVLMFLMASTAYVLALYQQRGSVAAPENPITPVTMISAVVAFLAILALSGLRNGFRLSVLSAVVGTIAAPMIFELPFDLIVMWRTYPPTPQTLYTLLFFLPLFLIELSSFALLTLSPLARVSRITLFLLAGMFLVFAVWAAFGFAYPSAPFPIAMNTISKLLAFAVAVSLFISQGPRATRAAPIAAGAV